MTEPTPLTLHPHEAVRMAHGSALLLRPVLITDEPDNSEWRKSVFLGDDHTFYLGFPPNAQNVRPCGPYWKCDAPAGEGHVSRRVLCPYGWLDDVIETDAGPVVVRSVRVVRVAELSEADAVSAGGRELPAVPGMPGRARYRLRQFWATTYPAPSWDATWVWAVEVAHA